MTFVVQSLRSISNIAVVLVADPVVLEVVLSLVS